MSEQLLDGHCLCGNIEYQVVGPTIWSGYCHCESCRRFTGAVVTNWLGIRGCDLVFTKGALKIYQKNDVRRGFCADCGSSITYEADRFPDYIQIHLGTLDQINAIKPQAHVHHAEHIEWFEVNDQLPKFPGSAASNGSWRDN